MKPDYNLLTDQLTGDYRTVFKQVELYATVNGIEYDTQNEMLMELMDLMLSAQKNDKPVEKIIGSDVEQFCKSFFSEYQRINGNLKKFRDTLYRCSWLMLIFQLFEVIFPESDTKNPLLQPTSISGYLTGIGGMVIFTTLLSILLKPVLFRWRKLTTGLYCVITLMGGLGLSFGLMALMGEDDVMIPNWIALVIPSVYILCFIIARTINRYRKYGSIWRPKEPGETSFFRAIDDQVNQELPFELLKRYNKINEKHTRKGKAPMTPQEYTEKLRRDIKMSNRISVPLIGLLILLFLGIVIQNIITSGILDSLVLIVVLAIAEIPAMFIYWACHKGDIQKTAMLAECDRLGISFPEYVARLTPAEELSPEATEEDRDV